MALRHPLVIDAPTFIGTQLGRMVNWIGKRTCRHVMVMQFDPRCIRQVCSKCGTKSAGFTLNEKLPKPRYSADREKLKLAK